MYRSLVLLCFISVASAACGGGGSSESPDAPTADAAPPIDAPPALQTTFGGDRPAKLAVPKSYDAAKPTPLVIVLHEYFVDPNYVTGLLGLSTFGEDRGVLYLAPHGLANTATRPQYYWNATDACCDFFDAGTDDVGYLVGLIKEIQGVYNVDPKRIYVIGHSNGSFMALRLACERADLIAAVISVSGANTATPDSCKPTEPVSVLHVHGDQDDVILYAGGSIPQNNGDKAPYPSAKDTVAAWASYNKCATATEAATSIDAVAAVDGDETTREHHTGCPAGVDAELWTTVGGSHYPMFSSAALTAWGEWLEAHRKR